MFAANAREKKWGTLRRYHPAVIAAASRLPSIEHATIYLNSFSRALFLFASQKKATSIFSGYSS
jgi:hypothetical protein